jgi:cytochrome c biogenesis protein CcmG, thiol:disulfide interchange protein DsbE
MSLNKAVIPLGIFLVLAALFMYVLTRMDEGEYNPRDIPTEFIGKPAPHFSLPELYDPSQLVTPEQFKGKPWLLNVFGTWCAECWREHEYLVSLAQRGVPIVGLKAGEGATTGDARGTIVETASKAS